MGKLRSRLTKGLLAGGAALALAGGQPARADELNLRSDSPLLKFFLPFAPLTFDIAVQGGRGFAEISYGERRYDPITESFVVSDLHIHRDALDVAMRRLRVAETSLSIEGLAFDTRDFRVEPALREGLQRIGRETLSGSLTVNLKRNDARSALGLDVELDLDDVGAVSMQGTVDNFHLLVPLNGVFGAPSYDYSSGDQDPFGAMPPIQEPTVSGTLNHAEITYRDHGLFATALAIVAEQQGVDAGQLKAGIATMPSMTVPQILAGLPGGASPALQDRANGWAKTVERFIQTPDAIRVTFDPVQPVPLMQLQPQTFNETVINALNPDVMAGSDALNPKRGPSVPVTPVAAAAALARGDAVPQDRAGSAGTLMSLASSGNVDAVKALASAFGTGAPPTLAPTDQAALYEYLIIGRALGERVSDETLASLVHALPATAVRGSEIAAGVFFRDKTPEGKSRQALNDTSVAGYTPAGLRALAYDIYEGTAVPRDFTEAYAVALVAAAAGDVQAANLRDHLQAAAQEGRIVIVMDQAQTRAATLWARYPHAQ